ncbi:MAG: TSUP family transporter [Planctomycetota bacterium]|nr:TSUP family transporter [Planctomycetota bacterium]
MWIIYPLLFLAGFVDSIAGGGGLISISSFLAIGVPPHLALGTNKFSAFLGTGLSTLYFARRGHIKWDSAIYAFGGALIGSMAGARLVLLLDERTLAWLMLIAIPAAAILPIVRKDFGSIERKLPPIRNIAYSLLTGFVIGGYDGFFGPGAGTFLILAFTAVLGLKLLTACGNAKAVNFASNIGAVAMFMGSGDIDYGLGVPCAACALLGNYLGARLAVKNGVKIIRPAMLFVIALLLIKIAGNLWR